MTNRVGKPALFIGLTFLVNWGMVGLFFLFDGEFYSTEGLIMAIAYMFVPMTVVIFLQKTVYKEAIRGPLGVSFKPNRWFVVAWLLPPAMAFATLGVSLVFPGIEYSPDLAGWFERMKSVMSPEQIAIMKEEQTSLPFHPFWFGLVQGLIAGITINVIPAFGEELGWRGFLQRELEHLGFWKSSLIIGIVWGIWHAPLVLAGHNYPEHPVAGVFMIIFWCVLLAPLFAYIRMKSKSVIAAAVMHGTLNGTAGLSLLVLDGGNDLTIGVTGLAGFIVLGIVVISLFFFDRSLSEAKVMAS